MNKNSHQIIYQDSRLFIETRVDTLFGLVEGLLYTTVVSLFWSIKNYLPIPYSFYLIKSEQVGE